MPFNKLPTFITEAREDEAAQIPKWQRHLLNHSTPCPDCSYDLHKVTTGRCPECGRVIDADVVWPNRWRTSHTAAVCGFALATLTAAMFLLRGLILATSSQAPVLDYPAHTRLWILPAALLILTASLTLRCVNSRTDFQRRSPTARASTIFWSCAAAVTTAALLLIAELVLS